MTTPIIIALTIITSLAGSPVLAVDDVYSVTAKSLSYEDVSAAVKDVRAHMPDGHGTINLPAGDANWGNNRPLRVLGGINLIGQGTNETIIRWSHTNPLITYNDKEENDDVIDFSPMRVSGISFLADATSRGTALMIRGIEGFRVDHIYLETTKPCAYMMMILAKRSHHPRPYGVIDHCSFKALGTLSYGIYVGCYRWANGDQNYTEFMGRKDNVFIEDCSFYGLGHHFALFNGGTCVFRHNSVISDGCAAILDSHELAGPHLNPDGTQQVHGGRFMEVYNNTFEAAPGTEHKYSCLRPRNGGGVMFNNTIKDARYPYSLAYGTRAFGSTTPPGAYPGLDQIHFWWIWDDEVVNPKMPGVSIQGAGAKENIKEGRDFFLRAPDPKITHPDDALIPGFREPDYKPYTYPHPLVSGLARE